VRNWEYRETGYTKTGQKNSVNQSAGEEKQKKKYIKKKYIKMGGGLEESPEKVRAAKGGNENGNLKKS